MRKALSDEAVEKLQIQIENNDIEAAHSNADAVLCELLNKLGYKEVVEKYRQVPTWCA